MADKTNQRFEAFSSLNFAIISEQDEDILCPNATINTLTYFVAVVPGGGWRNWTQGLVHAKSMLGHWATSSTSPCDFVLLLFLSIVPSMGVEKKIPGLEDFNKKKLKHDLLVKKMESYIC